MTGCADTGTTVMSRPWPVSDKARDSVQSGGKDSRIRHSAPLCREHASGRPVTVVINRPVRTPAPVGPGRRPLGALVRAYVALTKPRIIELLLITTLPVMF